MYAGQPDPGGWDGEVASKVASTAAANNNRGPGRVLHGHLRDVPSHGWHEGGWNRDAALVGGGHLPTNNHTDPDCPSGAVGPVAGVQAQGHKSFDSFVSQVMGIAA